MFMHNTSHTVKIFLESGNLNYNIADTYLSVPLNCTLSVKLPKYMEALFENLEIYEAKCTSDLPQV
jgi:hypothetical protein